MNLIRLITESSTLNRVVRQGAKILFVVITITVYNFSISPQVEREISTQLILAAGNETPKVSDDLQPILPTEKSYSDTLYSFSLKEDKAPELSTDNTIVTSDPRILAMRRFLIDYSSPMYPYADVFIKQADKYGLDWRLVASISGVESAFGNLIPYKSNNAWGWKGDPTREWSQFKTWSDGISTVTERLALGYGTELTPFEIEPTYCPPCGLNPEHAWANGVTNYMNELTYYLESLR